VIERAVILSAGATLAVPIADLEPVDAPAGRKDDAVALEQVRRGFIVDALQRANWMVAGPRGAASRLGIKRTTLHSMMKRLEIVRPA